MKNCNKVKTVSKTKETFKYTFKDFFTLGDILNIKVTPNKKVEQILKQFFKKSKIAE